MRRRLSLIGAMLLHKGDVDGLICGTWSTTAMHLNYVDQVHWQSYRCQYLCLHERLVVA
jgi:phosphotransacetylase